MVKLVGELVHNLIVVVIVATLLQMLVPRSAFKRYIDMVAGLVIMLILLSPWAAFIASSPSAPQPAFAPPDSDRQRERLEAAYDHYHSSQQELLREALCSRILEAAADRLSDYHYRLLSGHVELDNERSLSEAAIDCVYLQVAPAASEPASDLVLPVPAVNVEIGKQQPTAPPLVDGPQVDQLRTAIGNLLQIDGHRVKIEILMEG